jgi:hypothetical protein
MGEIDWGDFAFFKEFSTVDDEDATEVEFSRARGTRRVRLEQADEDLYPKLPWISLLAIFADAFEDSGGSHL